MLLHHKKGQSTLEYALLVAAVVAGLVMMQIYLKRGVGGRMKSGADDIGEQFDPAVYSSDHTTKSKSERKETVIDRVTKSELIRQGETTTRWGNEKVAGWQQGENLHSTH